MKLWLTKAFKLTLLFVLLLFIGTELSRRISFIKWDQLILDIRFLFLTILSAIIVRIFIGLFYGELLRLFKNTPSFHIGVAVGWLALLGKYIPGKLTILASVIYLLKRYHVRTTVSVIVPILSNGLAVLIAFIIASPLLFSPWAQKMIPFSDIWFIILILMGFLTAWPKIFIGFGNILLKILRRPPLDIHLTINQMLFPFFLVFCQCIFHGITTWCMAKTIFPQTDLSLIPMFISITALSGAIGVLAFFAPAGLGVIEGLYLLLFTPLIGGDIAALLTVSLRLLQTIADILMAIIGALILKSDLDKTKSDTSG